MRILLIILSFTHIISFGQYTYIPDDNFEQSLINLGYDFLLDDYVETASIDTITYLYIPGENISDLTGIEEFVMLTELYCHDNQLTNLNLSNNPVLFEVVCANNQLIEMDVRNGNNSNLWYFNSFNNPSLNCISVDDTAFSAYNWAVDTWTSFSYNCNSTSINPINTENKRLISVTDMQGRKTRARKNIPLIYIYSDGSVEKKIIIGE